MPDKKQKVGLAFQGGGFPAGAIGAGVVKYLVENGAFDKYDIDVFSGTSAGALNASVCWGYKLKDEIKKVPEVLEKLWLHNALGIVHTGLMAQSLKLIDHVAYMNPAYEFYRDEMVVPVFRGLMKDWVLTYIPVEEWIELRDKATHIPGLLLGAADVRKGDIKVFTEKHFCLETILASGSLDEVNGLTIIEEGLNKGVYCDGAWGTNPPIRDLIDYGINELWFIEVFPKKRETIPSRPWERLDRKDELWQNSLVEQELHFIEKVNEWLAIGLLNNPNDRYQHIEVKRMPMERDLPVGAAFFNSPAFIREMIDYGHQHAQVFLNGNPELVQKTAERPHLREV
ncbi:MAG: patatin-like phospholipase family protein [Anaerolineaceae bacterium]|nr:patatin-like phospholipase family protein [Anaerolineaceae bacterium]